MAESTSSSVAGQLYASRSHPRSPRLLSLALATLAAYVILWLGSASSEIHAVLPYFLLTIALQVGPLFAFGKPDLFAPPVYKGLFAALALIASFTVFCLLGRMRFDFLPYLGPAARIALTRKILIAYSLGTVMYYGGYFMTEGKWLHRTLPHIGYARWNRARAVLCCTGIVIIFVVNYAFFQSRVGGSLFDLTRLAEGKQVWRNDPTMSWLTRGVLLGFLPVLFFFLYCLKKGSKSYLLLAAGVFAFMGILVTRLGQRGSMFFFGMVLLIVFHYQRRRVPPWLLVALWLASAVIVNVLGSYRTPWRPREPEMPNASVTETLSKHEDDRRRFDAMGVVFYTFPKYKDLLLGESWLAWLVSPIPRWVWPEKHKHFIWRDTGIVVNLVGEPVPSNYLSTLYANFSWTGIIIGFWIWGSFHRGLYEWRNAQPGNERVTTLYALVLVYFGFTTLNLSATFQYIIPTYFIIRFASRMRGQGPLARLGSEGAA